VGEGTHTHTHTPMHIGVHRDIECVTGRDALLKSREAYVSLIRRAAGLPGCRGDTGFARSARISANATTGKTTPRNRNCNQRQRHPPPYRRYRTTSQNPTRRDAMRRDGAFSAGSERVGKRTEGGKGGRVGTLSSLFPCPFRPSIRHGVF
jgi:hypothetical protein